ncbi:esterase [Sphaerisporangium siamense]|uniref:Putative dienelactone hydrolase n=1 Tax=Sphaerisporangium siamense TaxID=795645 RepID=A0A7W7D667_9ACTN|nr:alpha/beta hydrolase [Sphaerisporangium siamense]MBB4701039.1 putative dienelactone hydrolase [Sphaerisporangium siamense]GII85816.1 esterase [Sphaerisporangium siamense]
MTHALTTRPVPRGGRVAMAGLLALTAAVSPLPLAPAAAAPLPATARATVAPVTTPYLPDPTGPRPVGSTTLYLKDTSRPDPWVPTEKARELMVTLWYPAARKGRQRASYLTAKESELHLKGGRITTLPFDVLSTTRTNSFTDVKPAGRGHGLPLVVLSPGFTKPRATLSGLAEDLASHGYVVAAIDHTYENYATTFPDGRIATCAACEFDDREDFGPKTVEVRAADVSFVLDELTGRHPKWKGASLIDRSRIAMVGQSIGGAGALGALAKEPRVRAAIDMDGTTYATLPENGLTRPFLFLGAQQHHSPGQDTRWDRDWALLHGWKRWLVVAGAGHQSFTDIPLIVAEQLGVDLGYELKGSRSMEITRRYVRAFLDRHLRGVPQPLLDAPSSEYPEVKFCAPETKTCA